MVFLPALVRFLRIVFLFLYKSFNLRCAWDLMWVNLAQSQSIILYIKLARWAKANDSHIPGQVISSRAWVHEAFSFFQLSCKRNKNKELSLGWLPRFSFFINLSKIPREYCYLNKKKQKPEGYFTILNEPCMDLFKSSVRRDMS